MAAHPDPTLGLPAELSPAAWERASRALLAKAIGELAYEGLLTPVPDQVEPGTDTGYVLVLDGGARYEFLARRGGFGGWRVHPDSLRRNGEPACDVLEFVLDAHDTLGLAGDTAGHLVRELTATLIADCRHDLARRLPVSALAELSYAELEGHMTGHPWLVPNKGRLGWSALDGLRYAPEARRAFELPWLAVSTGIAEYRGIAELPASRLYAEELDAPSRMRFTAELLSRGLDPDGYLWLPVHPWQWDEVVVPLFATELAHRRVVPLGEGPDRFLPQQSLRTLTNLTTPIRRHVKLPLSVLNTLVWRGLPTERTLAAPAVTAWVLGLRDGDPFLADECRVSLLGEVASVTVAHPYLERLPGVPYQYRELLGAIWRSPMGAELEPGERARTLASLLYVDGTGRAFVTELVARSGLTPREWLERLFGAMLPPLLHFLYRYGVVFSPHGENAIVVYDETDTPIRLAVKDFVDDVNVAAAPLPELAGMPDEVAAVLLREPPQFLCQFIQSGLFVGVFRYLADLSETQLGVSEAEFWGLVRAEILAYQDRFRATLADRFALFDLLGPDLERLCLNRNRLLLDGYRDRPERPHAAVEGRIRNPLHEPAAGAAAKVPAPGLGSRSAVSS
ncbi:MAG: IucA/IucC family siderophore biosynthesis protein [Sporichthyaceae bacterium]|nr:IucA/IucC family siderophore biosynthesis protein [Sporichthyaceae bacterium]